MKQINIKNALKSIEWKYWKIQKEQKKITRITRKLINGKAQQNE
jgi:hypothetical protein